MTKFYTLASSVRGIQLITLLLIFASVTFAQNNASTGVPVNATVIQGVTLTVSGTLNFNNEVAGTTQLLSIRILQRIFRFTLPRATAARH